MDPLDIANLGIGWLGKKPLTAMTDNASVASAFDGLRDAVLEDRNWTFAMSRWQVVRNAVPPAFGYSNAYGPLDSSIIRVVHASDPDEHDDRLEWEPEGRRVLANSDAAKLNIRALVRVKDSSLWSPSFCQALAARIAADLCIAMTNNRALAADMWKLYEAKLEIASGNDARQGSPGKIRSDYFARKRR